MGLSIFCLAFRLGEESTPSIYLLLFSFNKGFIHPFRENIIMSNILTYNIRLKTENQADFDLMYSTLLEHQKVWNHMSEFIFTTGITDKRMIHDRNYHECRKLFPDCPSQVIIRAKDSVYAAYKTARTNKDLPKLEEPCKLENLCIRLDKRIYTFLPDNKIKLSTVGKRIICSFFPYDKFTELFSKHSICDPLIFFRNGEFWLAVSFNISCPTLIENSCIGVDLGIKRLATTSEGLAYTDKQFLKEKRKLRYLKSVLRSKHQTNKSRSAEGKLKRLRRKESHRNRNLSHHIANTILQTKSNVIVMEDLTGIKDTNRGKGFNNRQSQVSYYDLRRILEYKAPLSGKTVVTVDPRNTSKEDHRGLPRGKRLGCRYYARDGKVFDADWNAAINIAIRYSRRRESRGCQLPVTFSLPIDGRLNPTGRPCQQANCEIRSRKPLCL